MPFVQLSWLPYGCIHIKINEHDKVFLISINVLQCHVGGNAVELSFDLIDNECL